MFRARVILLILMCCGLAACGESTGPGPLDSLALSVPRVHLPTQQAGPGTDEFVSRELTARGL